MRPLRILPLLWMAALADGDGFTSLMPKQDVAEFWSVEGTPAATWRVEKDEIVCTGKPNGFLAKPKVVPELHLPRGVALQSRRLGPPAGGRGLAERRFFHPCR